MNPIEDVIRGIEIDKSNPHWKTRLERPDVARFDAGKSYHATMTTGAGEIRLRLMPDVAPMHVTSFIYLSRMGFYDGLRFHRVIPGFMAQGGCPLGTGTGGPGYEYAGECSEKVTHDRPGLLSMANAGPGTDGSQFFLTFEKTPWLDGKHTIFGEVIEGQSTLKVIEPLGSSSGDIREPITIESVSIEVEG